MSLQVDAYLALFRNLSPELQATVLPRLVSEASPDVQTAVRNELEKNSWVVQTSSTSLELFTIVTVEANGPGLAVKKAVTEDPMTISILLLDVRNSHHRISGRFEDYAAEMFAYQLADLGESGRRFILNHSQDPNYAELIFEAYQKADALTLAHLLVDTRI